jgi:hypothetical protein
MLFTLLDYCDGRFAGKHPLTLLTLQFYYDASVAAQKITKAMCNSLSVVMSSSDDSTYGLWAERVQKESNVKIDHKDGASLG